MRARAVGVEVKLTSLSFLPVRRIIRLIFGEVGHAIYIVIAEGDVFPRRFYEALKRGVAERQQRWNVSGAFPSEQIALSVRGFSDEAVSFQQAQQSRHLSVLAAVVFLVSRGGERGSRSRLRKPVIRNSPWLTAPGASCGPDRADAGHDDDAPRSFHPRECASSSLAVVLRVVCLTSIGVDRETPRTTDGLDPRPLFLQREVLGNLGDKVGAFVDAAVSYVLDFGLAITPLFQIELHMVAEELADRWEQLARIVFKL